VELLQPLLYARKLITCYLTYGEGAAVWRSLVKINWLGMDDLERRIAEERARVQGEYRKVLETSVAFEKRIRNRWREKCRAKNERIAGLETRVAELELELSKERERWK
jgi:hypothetical protein